VEALSVEQTNPHSLLGRKTMSDQIDTTATRYCACANIRRTDLVVTQFYDGVLAPSGLYAIQFGLLSILAKLAPTTINRLAEVMDIDRATLIRNLQILIDENLVRTEEGEDRRMRLVLLTQEGEQTLRDAWPLWQEAQSRIERAFGGERFNAFLAELSAIRMALS
jgi:DNA-binding MarR family transcriptional regulator